MSFSGDTSYANSLVAERLVEEIIWSDGKPEVHGSGSVFYNNPSSWDLTYSVRTASTVSKGTPPMI